MSLRQLSKTIATASNEVLEQIEKLRNDLSQERVVMDKARKKQTKIMRAQGYKDARIEKYLRDNYRKNGIEVPTTTKRRIMRETANKYNLKFETLCRIIR